MTYRRRPAEDSSSTRILQSPKTANHSSNKTISSCASCKNPRGSLYQTEHQRTPKQPSYLVRGMIPETLQKLARYNGNNSSSNIYPQTEDLPHLSNLPKSSPIYHISEISKSSIIYHSFHQNIQTFISPPVPMLLSMINFRR